MSIEELIEQFPLTRERIDSLMAFVARSLLIEAAEKAGSEIIVTTDKNIRHQQNLTARKIALVVLEHSQWPMVTLVAAHIVAAVTFSRTEDGSRRINSESTLVYRK